MPFKEIYAVSFENDNLHPHLNLKNWDDMQRLATPNNQAEWIPDSAGTTFRLTRDPAISAAEARNSVFVVPPTGSLSIESRILLRATFDRPLAEGFDANGNLQPMPLLPTSQLSIPEPWAIGLNVGVDGDFLAATSVFLTCQFNRRVLPGGVRVNTPSALQNALPDEQADYLESPLNYQSYQGQGNHVPEFSFAHSFCGRGANADTVDHTSGSGFLKITRKEGPPELRELRDHRIYTSRSLTDGSSDITSIGALGITVATNSGRGRLSARLRSFSVSINDPLP